MKKLFVVTKTVVCFGKLLRSGKLIELDGNERDYLTAIKSGWISEMILTQPERDIEPVKVEEPVKPTKKRKLKKNE